MSRTGGGKGPHGRGMDSYLLFSRISEAVSSSTDSTPTSISQTGPHFAKPPQLAPITLKECHILPAHHLIIQPGKPAGEEFPFSALPHMMRCGRQPPCLEGEQNVPLQLGVNGLMCRPPEEESVPAKKGWSPIPTVHLFSHSAQCALTSLQRSCTIWSCEGCNTPRGDVLGGEMTLPLEFGNLFKHVLFKIILSYSRSGER